MKKNNIAVIFLVTLISSSLLLVTSLSTSNAENTTATFGITTVGSRIGGFSTDKDATRFLLSTNGAVQSITVYFGRSGFNAKAAIYNDLDGAPGNLIARSSNQWISASGWRTFALPQTSLTAGYYWLAVVCDSSVAFGSMMPTSANMHTWKASTYSTEFTPSFGTPAGYEATATSIYATYIPATSTPTSMPRPTPTSTMLGIYYDQACTSKIPSIDWGTLTPGLTQNLVIYVRNEGNVPITLSKGMSNFTPTSLSNYVAFSWDYANQPLSPSSVLKVTLTLTVSSSITGITSFNFDTVITATG